MKEREKMSKEKSEVSTNVFGGNVGMPNSSALIQSMKESADKNPRGGHAGSEYLNFSGKTGRYSFGSDQREVDSDEVFLVNIGSFEDGWVCWKGGKPAAQRMANISDAGIPTPDMEELGPFTGDADGWFQAKAFVLRSFDTEQQGYFRVNSISAVAAVSDFQKLFVSQAERGEPAWPVIQLDSEPFNSGGYKNLKPTFIIVGWLSDEQIAEALSEESDLQALMDANDGEEDAPTPDKKAKKEKRSRSNRRGL